MSRAEKERRRLRRKQRRARRVHPQRLEVARLQVDGQPPQPLRLVSYDITWERLDLADDVDPVLDRMPPEQRAALYEQLWNDPDAAIAALTTLLQDSGDSRTLRNWLTMAYSAVGDDAAAEREAKANYERYPNYLFARIGWAQFCMLRGRVEEVPVIFQDKYELKALYPDRQVFHVTEVVGFYGLMAEYFMRTDRERQARVYFSAMEQLAPEHPLTEQVRNALSGSSLLRLAKQMAGRLGSWAPRLY